MGLLEECNSHFGSSDLYEILSLPKTASEQDVKKAYKRLSLLVHPDRVEASEQEVATRKFQILSKIHFVLSDQERRAVYDETGEVDDDEAQDDKDWSNYWRLLFPRITVKDIDKFMSKYKGSEEEQEDLKKYYLKCNGDMDMICQYFLSYQYDDEDRYHSIINEMIASNEVPDLPKFTKESASKKKARQKKFAKEATEADEAFQDLAGAIAQRATKRFDDMISSLEEKYAKRTQPKKKRSNR